VAVLPIDRARGREPRLEPILRVRSRLVPSVDLGCRPGTPHTRGAPFADEIVLCCTVRSPAARLPSSAARWFSSEPSASSDAQTEEGVEFCALGGAWRARERPAQRDLAGYAMVPRLKIQSTTKPPVRLALGLVLLALIVALAYRASGTNTAAGVGSALAIAWWLWSARRSYREQGQVIGPRLVVDRGGELADEERPRLSFRRLRVANASSRAIQHVEVRLIKCGPAPAWFEPVRLQRTQGGAHPFDLPPHSEVYVDFVTLPQAHPEFIVVHDSAKHGGLPNGIAIQPLELTVEVTASGLPSVSFVFGISRSATGELEVVEKTRS
jgi:hypothetical protein